MPYEKGMYRSYFPLYTHKNYGFATENLNYGANASSGSKVITGLRVVLVAKNSTANVTVGLDYVRPTADSRHSVNGSKYILTLNEYASFHNDVEILKNNITRARKAMLFLLEPLNGKNGLVSNKYLNRHDSYKGVANGFWDIYPACNYNCETNLYFYDALLALANIEEVLAKNGVTITEKARIEWNDLNGNKQTAAYDMTADSLCTLAETVKGNINSVFYNEETGRFAWGVYDTQALQGNAAGTLMDYGFTELNLHAVASFVADDEKTASIMKWINGERIVSGDKITGGAINGETFTPVTTTVEHQKWKYMTLQKDEINSDFTAFYVDKNFGEECQDGGYIMHVTYYDLLARARYYGADNVRVKLGFIAEWFNTIKSKNTDNGGDYSNFFINHYGKDALQGADGNGRYGLHDEFKEAAMVYAVAPKVFLGLNAEHGNLILAPNITGMTSFGISNLQFAEHNYNCFVTATDSEQKIILSGINGTANSGLKVTVTVKLSSGQSVYLNGKVLESSEYDVQNGYATLNLDFVNFTLIIK